jgi:GTP-binding protein
MRVIPRTCGNRRRASENPVRRESRSIAARDIQAEFVGSFFALDQLPRDRLPQIAVAGRSNVGKSSLLNQIVGRKKLAKVSSTPGRTRSLNFFRINNRFHLVDLPGYGYAKVSKSLRAEWGQPIEDFLVNSEHLIGLVLLMDCRREPTTEDLELIEWLTARQLPVLIAVTKSDKLSKSALMQKVRTVESDLGAPAVAFSIVSGLGKQELMSAILDLVNEVSGHKRK